MSNQLATTQGNIIESVVIGGDLSRLTAEQRVNYYKAVCESTGLNPLTRPFDYITLNGKLTLYAKKDATDQLRKNDDVSITKLETKELNDIYMVTAYASNKSGRTDVATGAVNIAGLNGDALANALMKAETKSKRRVTLSICGLGLLDETEVETVPDAKVVVVDDQGVIEPEPLPDVPLDNIPDMSLELAESELNSKGKRYGDLDDKALRFMYRAITNHERTDENARKLAAIQVILAARGKAA